MNPINGKKKSKLRHFLSFLWVKWIYESSSTFNFESETTWKPSSKYRRDVQDFRIFLGQFSAIFAYSLALNVLISSYCGIDYKLSGLSDFWSGFWKVLFLYLICLPDCKFSCVFKRHNMSNNSSLVYCDVVIVVHNKNRG